jgi:hypothetical protein
VLFGVKDAEKVGIKPGMSVLEMLERIFNIVNVDQVVYNLEI